MSDPGERIEAALNLIERYGQIDGSHHKAWVIDQVVRTLFAFNDDYEAWVHNYQYYDDGTESSEMIYNWDEGTPP